MTMQPRRHRLVTGWPALVLWWCAALLTTAAEPVRVATFNVRNYLSMDRLADGSWRPMFPKPESEKSGVRAAIHAINADVLALQELGAAPYLEELRQDLAREGLVYANSHLLVAADPERHVAMLSRLPFKRVVEHAKVGFDYFGEPEFAKRGMLEIVFDSPVGEWTVFVVHLKSRYTNRPDDPKSATRRLAEARELREIVLERFPNPAAARFAVVGDFNDTPNAAPVARFLRRGATRITVSLPTADSRGETWTHYYEKAETYSRVDYLLLSPGLLAFVADGRGTVYDGEYAVQGSDHRPVYCDLEWPVTDRPLPESKVRRNPAPIQTANRGPEFRLPQTR